MSPKRATGFLYWELISKFCDFIASRKKILKKSGFSIAYSICCRFFLPIKKSVQKAVLCIFSLYGGGWEASLQERRLCVSRCDRIDSLGLSVRWAAVYMCPLSVRWRRGSAPVQPAFRGRLPVLAPRPPPSWWGPQQRQTDACCQNAGLTLTLSPPHKGGLLGPQGNAPCIFITPWNAAWKAPCLRLLSHARLQEGALGGKWGACEGDKWQHRKDAFPQLWLGGRLWCYSLTNSHCISKKIKPKEAPHFVGMTRLRGQIVTLQKCPGDPLSALTCTGPPLLCAVKSEDALLTLYGCDLIGSTSWCFV